MEKLIEFRNTNFAYNNTNAFVDFNMEILEEDIVTLIGPSGSGKTTLLKMLCKRLPNDSLYYKGINIKNHDVKELQKEIIVIFDMPLTCETTTEELKKYIERIGLSEGEIDLRINRISKFFDIENLLDTKIADLNKRQKYLIKILRFLIVEPKLLAVDNVLSNLYQSDLEKFFEYIKKNKITLLNVTTDLNQAIFGNKLYVLENFVLILEGSTNSVLKTDTLLKRLGFRLPLAVELSIELGHYELLKKLYTDTEKLVKTIWK